MPKLQATHPRIMTRHIGHDSCMIISSPAAIPRQNRMVCPVILVSIWWPSRPYLGKIKLLRTFRNFLEHRVLTYCRNRRKIATITASMIKYMSYAGWLDLPHPTVKYTERKTPRVLSIASRWMFMFIIGHDFYFILQNVRVRKSWSVVKNCYYFYFQKETIF